MKHDIGSDDDRSVLLVGATRLDAVAEVVNVHWPETIEPAQLDDPALWLCIRTARTALLETMDLAELL